jgi:hypothetical protein
MKTKHYKKPGKLLKNSRKSHDLLKNTISILVIENFAAWDLF